MIYQDFVTVLAFRGFQLDLRGPRSETYTQADGELVAVWDYEGDQVTVWVERGGGRVSYLATATTAPGLARLLSGKRKEA